jgi:hypothetical protein
VVLLRLFSGGPGLYDDVTWVLFVAVSVAVFLVAVRFVIRSARSRAWGRLALGIVLLFVVSLPLRFILFPNDAYRVEDTVRTALTSKDPSWCYDDVTVSYLEQNTKTPPPFADDICRHGATRQRADSVEVSDIHIDGDEATATAKPDGGSYDGSSLLLQLVKMDGGWKVDRFLGFASLDRAKFDQAFRQANLDFGFPPPAADCATAAERRLSDADVERIAVDPDPKHDPYPLVFVRCDRAHVEDRFIGAFHDLPGEAIKCVTGKVRSLADSALAGLSHDPIAFGVLDLKCDRGAALEGYRRQLAGYEDLGATGAGCVVHVLSGWDAARIVRFTYEAGPYQRLIDGCKT